MLESRKFSSALALVIYKENLLLMPPLYIKPKTKAVLAELTMKLTTINDRILLSRKYNAYRRICRITVNQIKRNSLDIV